MFYSLSTFPLFYRISLLPLPLATMPNEFETFESPFESYRPIKIIGEGGAGRVYEVSNATNEKFALKILAPERVTTERLKRFKNEIAFCQNQEHKNVIKVVDAGMALLGGAKCPFYVMRRYSGTLRGRIGQMRGDDALRAFAQILDGVEAAHLASVWHRDLKPENVLWSERDDGFVVADFGIAHFEVEELYTAVETKHAARMANFLYSSPEQRLRGASVDRRADIFALGLILNELFTLVVPQGAGFRRIGEVAPDFAYLDDLVDRMIQQTPGDRPASIEEIKKELIGRRNSFVALQRLDAVKKQVVSSAKPPDFHPISIVNLDYSGNRLTLHLNRHIPSGWAEEFRQPRGGHSYIPGYGPEQFQFYGDKAVVSVHGDQGLIQTVVNHAKQYTAAANSGYLEQLQMNAKRRELEERDALERKIKEAELRKNILSSIKL